MRNQNVFLEKIYPYKYHLYSVSRKFTVNDNFEKAESEENEITKQKENKPNSISFSEDFDRCIVFSFVFQPTKEPGWMIKMAASQKRSVFWLSF